jgi:Holliday junction resolvasome RuvABC endonuclease subunit
MLNVLALDVSIRATGYATIVDLHDGATETVAGLITPTVRRNGRPHKLTGIARLPAIAGQIVTRARRHDARLVAIEGYAYGAQSQAVTKLAELGGVIRTALWGAGIPYIEVASNTIKAYACGNGRADKDAMVAAAQDLYGYRGRDHNIADAMHLHALVADALGQGYAPDLASPAQRTKRRDAIATVVPLLPPQGVLTAPPTEAPHA